MELTLLTDERYTWRQELEHGFWHEPDILQQYRANRDSNLWRATRQVEKLCEYILFLEGAKQMAEKHVVHCDNCDADISSSKYYPMFRLRLCEETRTLEPGAKPSKAEPDLERMMNFCDRSCLHDWLGGTY